jgi:hypothetical protein
MGRYDALTQIEEPKKPTAQPAVTPSSNAKHPIKPATPPQEAKKTTKPQNRLSTNQSSTPDMAEKVEKYTTHILPSLAKKVKLRAVEEDINDYDVVNNALISYFDKNK